MRWGGRSASAESGPDELALGDAAVVRWLTEAHGVCLIPGSACGMPGHVRVCYANLALDRTRDAAARLRRGVEQLVDGTARLG